MENALTLLLALLETYREFPTTLTVMRLAA